MVIKYKNALICTLLSISSYAAASPMLERIEKSNPEAFTEAKVECESWAESEQVEGSQISDYMQKCMEDLVGYLDQDVNEEEGSDDSTGSEDLFE